VKHEALATERMLPDTEEDPWRADELRAVTRRLGIDGDISAPRTLWIDIAEGMRLRALDWGGSGAPVLLLHGGALTAQTWDYVCVGLRSEFRLIALDMRGHGESSWSGDYSIGRLAADAAQTAAALGILRLHVVGMSLGGVAAAELALTTTGLVNSLTMVDVAPGVEFEGTARMRGFINGMISAPSVEAVIEAAMRTSPSSDRERVAYRMRALLRRRGDGEWEWRRDAWRMVDYFHILSHIQGLEDRVGEFRAPFLMVRGGRSRSMPAPAAAAFAGRFRNGRFVEVPDAGHNVQEDNPAALITELRRFWNDVAGI
jgi:pimeloyl-ACP methyl ester carboxylesterase